jgi:hypothetical protein
MNVLIACECSGVIRRAFRARGHNAYSCDLKPAEDESQFHFQKDALNVIKYGRPMFSAESPLCTVPWDLVIAHPICTRLANSGSLRLYKGGKFANGVDLLKFDEMHRAALFFREFFTVSAMFGVPRLCVENPIQHLHAREAHACGRPTQIIQPFNFGEDASKATALWLRNLPPLVNTKYFPPRIVNGKRRWGNQTDSGQNKLAPSEHRAADRSRTYEGIAEAMAQQWGTLQ